MRWIPAPPLRARARAAVVLGVALLAAAAAPAAASAVPQLAITSPAGGSATNDTTPVFAGEVGPLETTNTWCQVSVELYAGGTAAGTPIQTLVPTSEYECNWATAPAAPLVPGTYTVQATAGRGWLDEEGEFRTEPMSSAPVTFTVDNSAPSPAIAGPTAGTTIAGSSLAVSGSAGTATGDLPAVTVQVFAGGEAAGTPVQAIEVPSHEGLWSGALAGLAPGTYTLQAQQTDAAGNVGASAAVPITLVAPPPPPPPSASFTWFPEQPRVGETVTLVSSSTDLASPITSFAWGLSATELFQPGRSTITTTFATPGPHVVRLRATDAAGRSGTATQTITVRHQAATLMQPFPIVRIAGRETRRGVKLTLLTVAAPVSARVTVRIRGAGVRTTSESRTATVGRRVGSGGMLLMSFPRFARSLAAGVTLEIRVTKAGQIGKLTRFVPRRGRLPTRSDLCLSTAAKSIPCPTS